MQHPENDKQYKGLVVNEGVQNLPQVNPYATFRRQKRELRAEEYVEGILRGDITLLGQAVTLIESSLPKDQAIAQKVIEQCLPYSGNSVRLGITGVPGAGKSTFIEALGTMLCHQGKHLAVLAIDPSSERSKGSILGDKTRMNELSTEANAFIRPSPSAGSLGGVQDERDHRAMRGCGLRHDNGRDCRRGTERDRRPLDGGLLSAAASDGYGR